MPYIKKNPVDCQKRGPKLFSIDETLKTEINQKYKLGVPIMKLVREYKISFHHMKNHILTE